MTRPTDTAARLHCNAKPPYGAAVFASMLLAASVHAQPAPDLPLEWPTTFELIDASATDSEVRMDQCLGRDAGAKKTHLSSDLIAASRYRGSSTEITVVKAEAGVVAWGGRWACVRYSSAGFPIWPLAALSERQAPTGKSQEEIGAFREALLREVATSGSAKGLVLYDNGNAHEVVVQAQKREPGAIKTSSRFLKADSYAASDYAITLAPGTTQLTSVERGDARQGGWKLVLPMSATTWPVKDEYVVISGTPFTEATKLTDTQWVTKDGRSLNLLDGAIATAASRERPDSGQWRIEDGVLLVRMQSGVRYSLVLTADSSRLEGVLRRTIKSAAGGEEFQNPLQFARQN